jgi:hypothetical protein
MGTRLRGIAVAALAGALLGGPAAAQTISGLRPVEPQPAAQQLAPGLAVQYTYAIVNHIAELKGRKLESGPPLSHLEWKMGSGQVLTSKSREGVGALISGYLLFEKPGSYAFEITSNDGVRVEIGGQLIHEDPGVHSDTTTDPIEVKIDRPGWYPISIVYFQKRYTATLVVRWTGPGAGGKMAAIPAKALARPK